MAAAQASTASILSLLMPGPAWNTQAEQEYLYVTTTLPWHGNLQQGQLDRGRNCTRMLLTQRSPMAKTPLN
ncbi:hypothetical protein P7K49_011233, partial [Saguinus oedipus]